MSRRKPNSTRPVDCNGPEGYRPAVLVQSAADLRDDQVWFLTELAMSQGGHPADRMWSLYRVEATEADRALIQKVVNRCAKEWEPWARMLKHWRPEWWPEGQ